MTAVPDVAAVILDLDDTLAATGFLEAARSQDDPVSIYRNLGRVALAEGLGAVLSVVCRRPTAVVTRSRRWYAEMILRAVCPQLADGPLVCYEDTARTKPYPEPLWLAASRLGITDMGSIAVVGDHPCDIIAAYRAGMRAVACQWCCGADTAAAAAQLCPDAVLRRPSYLTQYLENPTEFLPPLERQLVNPSSGERRPREIGLRWPQDHFKVQVLGRYFGARGDTRTLHEQHELTRQILTKFDAPFHAPDAWIDTLNYVIDDVVRDARVEIVTVIPHKPGKEPRLERLLAQVEALYSGTPVSFVPDVFGFADGAEDVKDKPLSRRTETINASLSLQQRVRGRRILVLDDVVTTGATLGVARRLLLMDGARVVHLLAVAKTVSDFAMRQA